MVARLPRLPKWNKKIFCFVLQYNVHTLEMQRHHRSDRHRNRHRHLLHRQHCLQHHRRHCHRYWYQMQSKRLPLSRYRFEHLLSESIRVDFNELDERRWRHWERVMCRWSEAMRSNCSVRLPMHLIGSSYVHSIRFISKQHQLWFMFLFSDRFANQTVFQVKYDQLFVNDTKNQRLHRKYICNRSSASSGSACWHCFDSESSHSSMHDHLYGW